MSAARSEAATPLFEGWRTVAHIFFAEYRDHFNRLDGKSIAKLWNAPSGVMEGQTVVLWDTRAKVEANHVALCERYRFSDFGSADFEIVHIRPIGDEAMFVHVIWTMRRRDGAVSTRFGTGYQMLYSEDGARIVLAVAHGVDDQVI